MQIVIDIPEEEYNLIMLKQKAKVGGVTSEAEKYIAKGTPLPKGHGDLKDVDEIERIWKKGNYVRSALLFAPTVIEADKDGE